MVGVAEGNGVVGEGVVGRGVGLLLGAAVGEIVGGTVGVNSLPSSPSSSPPTTPEIATTTPAAIPRMATSNNKHSQYLRLEDDAPFSLLAALSGFSTWTPSSTLKTSASAG